MKHKTTESTRSTPVNRKAKSSNHPAPQLKAWVHFTQYRHGVAVIEAASLAEMQTKLGKVRSNQVKRWQVTDEDQLIKDTPPTFGRKRTR